MLKVIIMIDVGVIYLYMNEVYPSEYRGIGVGFCAIIGRFGGILAPFVSAMLISVDIYP